MQILIAFLHISLSFVMNVGLTWCIEYYTEFIGIIQVIISKFERIHTINSVIILRLVNHVDKRISYLHYTPNVQGNEISPS